MEVVGRVDVIIYVSNRMLPETFLPNCSVVYPRCGFLFLVGE
jgi:hypothetical protein